MSETVLINLAAYASLMMGFFIFSLKNNDNKIQVFLRIWAGGGFIFIAVYLFLKLPW